jgi:hypothetical protein
MPENNVKIWYKWQEGRIMKSSHICISSFDGITPPPESRNTLWVVAQTGIAVPDYWKPA